MAEPSRPREKRGVLFGPERTGLDNDEVALADAILTFPANPAYASLNLAQAVLLVGYEWFKAAYGDAPRPPSVERRPSPAGDAGDDDRLLRVSGGEARRRRVLQTRQQEARHAAQPAQHLSPPGDDRTGRRTLWGVVVRLVEGPRVNVQTRKRNRPIKPPPDQP